MVHLLKSWWGAAEITRHCSTWPAPLGRIISALPLSATWFRQTWPHSSAPGLAKQRTKYFWLEEWVLGCGQQTFLETLVGTWGKGRLFLILMGLEWPEPRLPTTEQVCLRMMPTQGKQDPEEERGRGRFGLLDPALPPLIREPINPSYGFKQPTVVSVTT